MAPDDAGGSSDRADASSVPSLLSDLDLWLLFAVTLVGVGNVSSVSPAFPQVVEVFGISRVQVGWVVTAYSLPGILSAPLVGMGADRLGRKRVLVPTLFVFGIAGGACALACSFPVSERVHQPQDMDGERPCRRTFAGLRPQTADEL